MRIVILTILLLALSQPSAIAQGNGNGNGQGSGGSGSENGNSGSDENGNGSGNSGNGGNSSGSNGSANGNSGGNGNSSNAGGNGNSNAGPGNNSAGGNPPNVTPAPAAAAPGTGIPNSTALSEDAALEASSKGKTVSLGSLLPDVQARTGGEMIDAQLLQVQGFLVYAVKALGADGRVTTQYYYAQTGIFIGSEP